MSPNSKLTAERAAIILQVLQTAARKGEKCPTNDTLGRVVKCRREGIVAVIHHLVASGAIKIDRQPNHRIVEIVATGDRTAAKAKRTFSRTSKVVPLLESVTARKVLECVQEAEAAGEMRPMGKTMARMFGASRATISRILLAYQEEGLIAEPKVARKIAKVGSGNTAPADDWQASIRHGSAMLLDALKKHPSMEMGSKALLAAIRQHHPERIAA